MNICGKGNFPECQFFTTGGCVSPSNCIYKIKQDFNTRATSNAMEISRNAEIARLTAENAALRARLGKVPVFEIYQDVFIIDYLDERGYSVRSGKAIIRSCFIRHIMQVGKDSFIYFVQPNDLPKELLNDSTLHDEYWDRSFYAKDIFADREAAEARLAELKGEKNE